MLWLPSLEADLYYVGVRAARIIFKIWNIRLFLWLHRTKQAILTDLLIHWCVTGYTNWSAFTDNVLSESCLDKPQIFCNSPKNSSQDYFDSVKTWGLLTEVPVTAADIAGCWSTGRRCALLRELDLLLSNGKPYVYQFSANLRLLLAYPNSIARSQIYLFTWNVKGHLAQGSALHAEKCLPHRH